MEKTVDPLAPDEVLAALKGRDPTTLNKIRENHPNWIPTLPIPRSFDFKRANLSHLDLRHMDLSGIDFSWANLQQAAVDYADCSRTNFTGANLQGITLVGTQFHPVVGLFGHNRALYAPFNKSFSTRALAQAQSLLRFRSEEITYSGLFFVPSPPLEFSVHRTSQ